jgi:hypothetical protein
MLNKHEAREAARGALAGVLARETMGARTRIHLEAALALPRSQVRIYVGRNRGDGTAGVPLQSLEAACRRAALEQGQEVPPDASFRSGTDGEGELVGATFQWWVLDGGIKGGEE